MRSVNLLDDRGGLFVPYGYRRIRKVRLLGIWETIARKACLVASNNWVRINAAIGPRSSIETPHMGCPATMRQRHSMASIPVPAQDVARPQMPLEKGRL
jgi:hypothetical protein